MGAHALGNCRASCNNGALRALHLCQGIDDQSINSAQARLTWQISPKNKFAVYADKINKNRGHAMMAGYDANTASIVGFDDENVPACSSGTAACRTSATMSPGTSVSPGLSIWR